MWLAKSTIISFDSSSLWSWPWQASKNPIKNPCIYQEKLLDAVQSPCDFVVGTLFCDAIWTESKYQCNSTTTTTPLSPSKTC